MYIALLIHQLILLYCIDLNSNDNIFDWENPQKYALSPKAEDSSPIKRPKSKLWASVQKITLANKKFAAFSSL